mgnify:CR=1 FL=1
MPTLARARFVKDCSSQMLPRPFGPDTSILSGRFLRNRRRGEEEAHGLESTGATARLPELSREEIHRNLKYYGQSYGQQF